MKKGILVLIFAIASIATYAQHNTLIAKTVQVIDSIKINGKWYKKLVDSTALSLKQNKLTPGANITIVGDTISSTGGGGSTPNYSNISYSETAGNINDEFVVEAFGYIKPTNNFSHGTAIQWAFAPAIADHAGSFVTSVNGDGGGNLVVNHPTVKKVLYSALNNDETTSLQCLHLGPKAGVSNSTFSVKQQAAIKAKLVGSANAWIKSGATSANVQLTSFNTSTGVTEVNATGGFGLDFGTITATYLGSNNYRAVGKYSALGTYWVGFLLKDNATDTIVKTIGSSDVVIVHNLGFVGSTVSCSTFSNGVNEFLTGTGHANFWYRGKYEAYFVVKNYGDGKNIAKWQNYPSATSYKIMRSVNADFSGEAQIYSGTANSYEDNNVTLGTKYYYKMIAVVGSDVTVSTFAKTAR